MYFYRCRENAELFDMVVEAGRHATHVLKTRHSPPRHLELEIAPLVIDHMSNREKLEEPGLWDLQITVSLSSRDRLKFSAVSTNFIEEKAYAEKISEYLLDLLPKDLHKIVSDYLFCLDHKEYAKLGYEFIYLYFPLDGRQHFFSRPRLTSALVVKY